MGMTATERLRRLLDERGVEWTKPKSATEFIQTTFLCNGWGIEVLERNIGLCVTATNAFDTPEQTIAATLGNDGVERSSDGVAERGTYHITERNGDWYCDACGNEVGASDPTSELFIDGNAIELWEFCPRCGREVAK